MADFFKDAREAGSEVRTLGQLGNAPQPSFPRLGRQPSATPAEPQDSPASIDDYFNRVIPQQAGSRQDGSFSSVDDYFSAKFGEPQQPQAAAPRESEPGVMSDIGNLLGLGVNNLALNVRELVGRIPGVGQNVVNTLDSIDQWATGQSSAEKLQGNLKLGRANLSQATREAQDKDWWDSDKGTFGAAWSDPRAYMSGVFQSLPESVVTMFPAMRLAKGIYGARIAAGAAPEVAGAAAARAAAIAGGVSEGLLAGANSSRDVRDKINNMTDAQLSQSEAFQTLINTGMDPQTARQTLANDSATQAFLLAGTFTGMFGGIGDRFLAKAVTEGVGKTVVGRTVRGAVTEGLEEFPQESLAAMSENFAVQKADPSVGLTDDALNRGLGGLATGAVQGGGMSAVLGRRRTDPRTVTERSGNVEVTYPVDEQAANAELGQSADELESAVNQYFDKQGSAPTAIETPLSREERQRAVPRELDVASGIPVEPRIPAVDPELSAAAQSAQQRAAANPGTEQADFADLTPLQPLQAQQRLAIMRDEATQAGQDPLNLVIAPHPQQDGALAIQRLPGFQYTPELQGQRRPEPEAYNQVKAYVDSQRTDATPAAQRFVRDYDAGRINDTDVLLALDRRNPSVPDANTRIANAAAQAPSERVNRPQVEQVIQGLRQEDTPRARAMVRAYESGRLTDADIMDSMRAENPAAAAQPETPDQRLAAAALQGRLAQSSQGRILTSDATLSTKRAPVPGSTIQMNDAGTQHDVRVVPVQQLGAQGKVLQQIGRIFGKRLVAFQSDTLQADGFVLSGNNENIFVNAQSEISPLAVFGHELLHQLKRDNPQAYIALEAVIKRNIQESPELLTEYNGYDANTRVEEVTADLVGNRFQESQFWNDVFNEINTLYPDEARGIISRLVDALLRAVEAFRAAVRQPGYRADAFITDLDEVTKAIKDTFVQYTQDQRATAQDMEAGLTSPSFVGDNISAANTGSQNAIFSNTRGDAGLPSTAGQDRPAVAGDGADRTNLPRYGTPRAGAISATGRHYSTGTRQSLSGEFFGRGMPGAEGLRLDAALDPRIRRRIYFYVDSGNGITPESGVGSYAHEVRLDNLYDPASRLIPSQPDANQFESAVIDAGFDGYISRGFGNMDAVVLLGPKHKAVPVKALGPLDNTVGQRAVEEPTTLRKSLLSRELRELNQDAIPGAAVNNGSLEIPASSKEQANAELDRIGSPVRFSRVRPIPESIDAFATLSTVIPRARTGTFNRNRDLKVFLQDAILRASREAGVDLSAQNAETEVYLKRVGVADALYAIQSNANAVGWYDKTVTKALRVLGAIHPEINTDPNAKFAFTWGLAVTSNGLKVDKNFELAERAYRDYKRTGRMPTDIKAGQAQGAINEGLGLFNAMVDKYGIDDVRRFMETNFTVSQIKRATGLEITGEAAETTVRGAAILGPKIGNGFFSNLNGFFDQLTMDRWLMRTWGRWTGTLIENRPDMVRTKRAELRDLILEIKKDNKAADEFQKALGRRLVLGDLDAIALSIQKASMDPETRKEFNKTKAGEGLRKTGNALAKYLDGQKEAPSGPDERNFIRKVFSQILEEVRAKGFQSLTMSDLQALLWYPEKRLYDIAKSDEDAQTGYADDEAPDYANAAIKLARNNGVSDSAIQDAIRTAEQEYETRNSAGSAGRDAANNQDQVGTEGRVRGFTPRERREFLTTGIIHRLRSDRAGSEESSWAYTRKSGGDGKGLRVLGQPSVAVYTPAVTFKNALGKAPAATPKFFEVGAVSAQLFQDSLQASKDNSPFGAAVYVYPVESYRGMRMFLSEDGKAGFALNGDDIVSVFSGAPHSGGVNAIMQLAIQEGGRRLDAFDTVLPELYAVHGFKAVARTAWSDAAKPDDWNKSVFREFKNGEPDVVFMVYDKDYFGRYEITDGEVIQNYDDGAVRQAQALGSTPATTTTPVNAESTPAADTDAGVPIRKSVPRLIEDIPNDEWLQGKVEYAQKKGRNSFGVPHMGTITGYFDKPVEVSLRVLSRIPGQRQEQSNVREDSLAYIRENWDEVSQQPPYIEVAYNGEAWVNEGNHRIMVAAEKGLQSMPVEIRYFDGGQLRNGPLAPNRIPSLEDTGITQSRRRQVDTPEFKRWFGDSKVVDENGEPLVVYHGSPVRDFTVFDVNKINASDPDGPFNGFFFSSSERDADGAGRFPWGRPNADDAQTRAFYLSIKNPATRKQARAVSREIADAWRDGAYPNARSLQDATREELQKRGYDGIVFEPYVSPSREAFAQTGRVALGKNGGELVRARDGSVDLYERDEYITGYSDFDDALNSLKHGVFIAFRPEQIKSATGNNGNFDPVNPDITQSRRRQNIDMGTVTPAQEQALRNVGGIIVEQTAQERLRDLGNKFKANWFSGIFDQFAEIKNVDPKAYMLARLSKGSDGTLEATMLYGKPFINQDGVADVNIQDGGFAKVLASLRGEHDKFLWWVAAQRADRLKAAGLENLFSNQDIAALKSLNQGTFEDGTLRAKVYADALSEMIKFNNSVIDVATKSGLIDPVAAKLFKDVPYVPFYRVMEDGVETPTFGSGLINQQAFKKLKGGTQQLNNDLLTNLLLNWSHLFSASAKNRAAVATMDASENMGIAQKVPAGTKGSVKVRKNGVATHYLVDDPQLVEAVSALEYQTPGFFKPFSTLKRWLTFGVTVSPEFKVANLARDSIAAIATSNLDYNPIANLKRGFAASDRDGQTYASMMAGGGMIRFGSLLESQSSQRARALIEKEGARYLNKEGWERLSGMAKGLFEAYQEFGDKLENVNRAALYDRLVSQGYSSLDANFMARDLLDFSLQGRWPLVRFLAETVPFLNARLQGLSKLGRATKEDRMRAAYTVGAVALASIGLMLAFEDDEDWKKREDWDRDSNFWFKIGDRAFRMPKPFEVGAIGTLAERTWELMFNDDMTWKRYRQSLSRMIFSTFAMDPTPQAVKPLVDVFANKESFTNRPIEGMGMERLRPEDRRTEYTSSAAELLGQMGLPNPAALARGTYEPLSPVQLDYLVRGYFGWLGTTALQVSDYLTRPLTGKGERPEMELKQMPVIGRFVEDLPANSSRYVTQIYDQVKDTERAYNSYRQALKMGDEGAAAKIYEDESKKIESYKLITRLRDTLGNIRNQIRLIEADKKLSAADKRQQINDLRATQNDIAKQVDELVR